jgi:hypothetical protein
MSTESQAGLYRSLVTDKKMLIVLDNAADAAQVIPLLPGSPSCTVLVTSRRRLTSLVARHGAHHIPIGVLTDTDARQLLITRIGADRAAPEPTAVDDLLACCGGFALALDIVAARATMNPAIPLADLAAELRDTTHLSAFDDDDSAASLPTVLSWSLHALTDEQTHVYALLGIAPGPDISLPAAASLTGLSKKRTQRMLRALEEASLLHVDAHGRYSMHDLVRGYATDTANNLTEHARDTALRRAVDFYLHTANTADRLLYPHRWTIQLPPPAPGTLPHPLPDLQGALAWFNAEHANLLAAQLTATKHRWHETVWQLARSMTVFLAGQGHRHHWLAVWQTTLAIAEHLPDPTTHTLIHGSLGRVFTEFGPAPF